MLGPLVGIEGNDAEQDVNAVFNGQHTEHTSRAANVFFTALSFVSLPARIAMFLAAPPSALEGRMGVRGGTGGGGNISSQMFAAVRGTQGGTAGYDFALGLSRHPGHSRGGLVGRFAERVNAKTYWDLFDSTLDMRKMGQNLQSGMQNARQLHFNLDGMLRPGVTIKELRAWGKEAIGQGNVTNWELSQVLSSPSLRAKTTFYLAGKPIKIDGL